MAFSGINKTYKNIRRLQTILNVLVKNGFGHLIEQLNLQHLIAASQRMFGLKKHTQAVKDRITMPIRVRMVFEELGPTFIKFGQLLSLRPDLIPQEFVDEFQKLQEEVPPVSFESIKQQIESELRDPLEVTFPYFEKTAHAAASIAQVHKATLRDGQQIMVKVQRPKIRQIIETDINILFQLAHLIERYIPESKVYPPLGIVEEFAKSIKQQIQLRDEKGKIEKCSEMLQNQSIKVDLRKWLRE